MAFFKAQRDAQAQMMEAAALLRGRSPWADAARRFARNRAAMASVVVLLVIAVMSVVGPRLSPYAIDELAWDAIGAAPSLEGSRWFGTDDTGRDMWVLTWSGAQVSLAIGVMTTVVALIIGVIYGATAGYLGGRTDLLMMRFVDVLYALPLLFFIIILVTVFGRNIYLVFLAIGCVEWLTMARIVRGQTISLRRKEFVEAAEAAGVGTPKIVQRHIIPNVLGPVVVYVTLTIPAVILAESFLSFLGLGVQEPLTSLGRLISTGAQEM